VILHLRECALITLAAAMVKFKGFFIDAQIGSVKPSPLFQMALEIIEKRLSKRT